jgi:putative transcriptional regulator
MATLGPLLRAVALVGLLLPVAGVGVPGGPAGASVPRPAPEVAVPQRPMFLVARRNMGDPRFRETVLFLVKHNGEGTLGLVVNRPTQLLLSQVVPDLKSVEGTRHQVFVGGPVNPDLLLYLARSHKGLPETEAVAEGLYFGVARETLEALLASGTPTRDLRVYVGYAGWAPGQLEAELTRGDWFLVPADIDRIFAQDPEALWRKLIEEQEPPGNLVDNAGRTPSSGAAGEEPRHPSGERVAILESANIQSASLSHWESQPMVYSVKEIGPNELAAWLEQNPSAVRVVDVREPREYYGGTIPGAELMPLRTVPVRLSEIERDRPVVFICRSGARSGQACAFLDSYGYDNVYNLRGGVISWVQSGFGHTLPATA